MSMSPLEIQALRERVGLTLDGFSYVLGCSRSAVHLWEHGRCRPSQLMLKRLEKFRNLVENMVTCSVCGEENYPQIVRLDNRWIVRCQRCKNEFNRVLVPQNLFI